MQARKRIGKMFKVRIMGMMLCFIFAFGNAVTAGDPPHDFHVSITQIDYKPGQKALQITIKIFTDDLENALETLGAPTLHLGSDKEHPETSDFIARYLRSRLFLKSDDHTFELNYLGKEVEFDATWCFLEVTEVPDLTELEVTNRILLEIFDDQVNLTHVYKDEQEFSLLLRRNSVSETVSF